MMIRFPQNYPSRHGDLCFSIGEVRGALKTSSVLKYPEYYHPRGRDLYSCLLKLE